MEKRARGEAGMAEVSGARDEIEALVCRAERVSRMAGDGFTVELSPYMKSLLKLAREPEAADSATARRAASF